MDKFNFNLGDKVRDMVTGFTGIVTCRIEYLNGCLRVGLSPQDLDKEGKLKDTVWFDQQQCSLVKAKVVAIKTDPAKPKPVGGPYPNPPSH